MVPVPYVPLMGVQPSGSLQKEFLARLQRKDCHSTSSSDSTERASDHEPAVPGKLDARSTPRTVMQRHQSFRLPCRAGALDDEEGTGSTEGRVPVQISGEAKLRCAK